MALRAATNTTQCRLTTWPLCRVPTDENVTALTLDSFEVENGVVDYVSVVDGFPGSVQLRDVPQGIGSNFTVAVRVRFSDTLVVEYRMGSGC